MNYLRGPTKPPISSSALDWLDRPGGRIVVLVLLVVIGCAFGFYHIAWAEHISLGALSVLLVLLGEKMATRQ